MSEPTVIADDDVLWVMDWSKTSHKHKEPQETIFEEGPALARLLASETVFLNAYWWKKDWPEDAQKMTALCVNCSDVFAWGCADAEDLKYEEIRDLYEHWVKDQRWGSAVWCCKKLGEMPQAPVRKAIEAAGIWDLAGMNLKPNGYDAAIAARNLK